jgi:hypothetical protein
VYSTRRVLGELEIGLELWRWDSRAFCGLNIGRLLESKINICDVLGSACSCGEESNLGAESIR